MDDLSLVVRSREKTVLSSNITVHLMDMFRKRARQSFMARVHEIGDPGTTKVPEIKVPLAFVISGHMLAD